MIVRGGASPGVNTTQGVTWGGGGWGSGGDAFGGPSNFPSGFQYSVGPNGQLQYADQGSDGVYTASFCNRIINGGGGSSADIFQCSIRGYVGANAVAPALIPPALVPDPPTSVTVPSAVMIASTTPPSYRPPVAKTQCGANAPGIGMSDCWLALIAGVVTYLLIGGNDGQRQ
jgi:hypothetical protein